MSTSSTKMIILRSSDGEIFQVEESVLVLSQTIKLMIEDNCASNIIPMPNVSARTFAKVIEYCKKHVEAAAAVDTGLEGDEKAAWEQPEHGKKPVESAAAAASSSHNKKIAEETLEDWDSDFIKTDKNMLYDLIQAANYLDIPGLLELSCKRVADLIKGKSPEEIRQIFNIKSDFTPEEEDEVRRENSWAMD